MSFKDFFRVSTQATSPFDASGQGTGTPVSVSSFLTVQTFMNFTAMTGAIGGAWASLRTLCPEWFGGLGTPYALAVSWGVCSLFLSGDGLKTGGKLDLGKVLTGSFLALLNSLILAGAVVGTYKTVAALLS